jgi:hypothetical protein
VSPTSQWNIVLDDLQVSPHAYSGASWDELSSPDPLVNVTVASESGPTAWKDAPDDVFSITYSGTPVMTNVRASDIQSFLRFLVWDEDAFDPNDFIGGCFVIDATAAFSGLRQTLNCPLEPETSNSGFTLHWHLEPL